LSAAPEPTEYPRAAAQPTALLLDGRIDVVGRLVAASNVSLLVDVSLGETVRRAIYKPVSGERPLWDFPDGTLAGREVAAYLVSQAAGLDVVPVTVLREDAPFGPGSLQEWVDSDAAEPGEGLLDIFAPDAVPDGWLTVLHATGADDTPVVLAHAGSRGLRDLALLDAVMNNADRKGGHLIGGVTGDVRGVDHGLTFNGDEKLRTVLWGWAGASLRGRDTTILERLDAALAGALGAELSAHITTAEVTTTRRRAQRLLRAGRMPRPGGGRPAIPWPAF